MCFISHHVLLAVLSFFLSLCNILKVLKWKRGRRRYKRREIHNHSSLKNERWMLTEQVGQVNKLEWQKEGEGPPFPFAPTESPSSPQT